MTLCLSMIEQQARGVTRSMRVKGDGWNLEFGVHLKSETNRREGAWGARHRRVKKARNGIGWMLVERQLRMGRKPKLPCVVTFTRIGPKFLDDGDNLNSAFKAYRDEIARWLGVNDGDPTKVRWVYAPQEKARGYACRIQIEEGT